MERLNYHHLLYFWTTARAGGVGRAASELRRSQPTVSAQIRELEGALGEGLFVRSGRRLVLTETGREVFRYADEIFSLGRDLVERIRGRPRGRRLRLSVGVADTLSGLVAGRLLRPALGLTAHLHLLCREDRADRLIRDLSLREVDVVLSNGPVEGVARLGLVTRRLGECGVSFLGADRYSKLRGRFPRSLDDAPLLLPSRRSPLRMELDRWFDARGLAPVAAAESDDGALLNALAEEGAGLVPVPLLVEARVRRLYGLGVLGRTREVRERFFAIAPRNAAHPGVSAIASGARRLFA